MLELVTLVSLLLPQDDLHDRLHRKLLQMGKAAQDAFFHVLEQVPDKDRREAAKRFLRAGWNAFEKTHHRKGCCVKKAKDRLRKRIQKRVLDHMRSEWKAMSDEEKKAWVAFFLEIYRTMPEESKKEMTKLLQAEFFKAMRKKK